MLVSIVNNHQDGMRGPETTHSRHRRQKNIDLQRETEEKARQPETKLSAKDKNLYA
jgi:hypothetical protein